MGHGTGTPNRGGKVVSDALMPMEYKGVQNWQQASFKDSFPDEIKDSVNCRWSKEWGFAEEM
jgi:hypothetical protein